MAAFSSHGVQQRPIAVDLWMHDLLKVGGGALHTVPVAEMLNHDFFNYHSKFFHSLVANNRYRLRYVAISPPFQHADLGNGNSVFEGDHITQLLGAERWTHTSLPSGMIRLLIERQSDVPFVLPIDFAEIILTKLQSQTLRV